MIVPVGLFSARKSTYLITLSAFIRSISSIPYAESDDIDIQLPAGWQVSSLPKGWNDTGKVVAYTLTAENDNGKLHLTRIADGGIHLHGREVLPSAQELFPGDKDHR